MEKLGKHKIFVIISSLIILLIAGCEKLSEDYNKPVHTNTIKIGVVGDVSILREQIENIFFGAQLAAEEINQSGGVEIDGENFEIELIYKNSAGSSEEGISVTNELINEGVNLIIGPTFSSVAIEMAEFCIGNEVLMMTYSATTPELSFLIDNDLIWRTCPSDLTFGTISAQYCYDSLKYRDAAILSRDDRFGQGLSQIIYDSFETLGGNITNNVSFPGDILDLATYDLDYELNTILGEPVDLIYIIAFPSEIPVLANKIYNNSIYQALGNKPHIFLADGITAEELIKNGNPEILKTIMGITSTNEGNPNYSIYKSNYINRFGFPPATYSENAYDAIYCLAYAILKANSSESFNVTNFLREVSGNRGNGAPLTDDIIINVNEFNVAKSIIEKGQKINYEGASGPINFNYFGDPVPKIVIWEIENNEFVEISYYGK